ncbi:hypothetical protein HND97_17270 [Vibrio cholerae]|nr:hypothetical protein HND97_17270 [Vibrio cholerae]
MEMQSEAGSIVVVHGAAMSGALPPPLPHRMV